VVGDALIEHPSERRDGLGQFSNHLPRLGLGRLRHPTDDTAGVGDQTGVTAWTRLVSR
jgi:hypothetical protein